MDLIEATQLALQGKLVEVKQEIHTIYDDEGPELQEFVDEIDKNYKQVFKDLSKWTYGYHSENIAKKGYEVIQNYLDRKNLPIDVVNGKTTYAYNIGNNNQREIIYHSKSGDKIIGYLHITNNMFGQGIIWVSNLSDEEIGFNNFNRIDETGAYTSNK